MKAFAHKHKTGGRCWCATRKNRDCTQAPYNRAEERKKMSSWMQFVVCTRPQREKLQHWLLVAHVTATHCTSKIQRYTKQSNVSCSSCTKRNKIVHVCMRAVVSVPSHVTWQEHPINFLPWTSQSCQQIWHYEHKNPNPRTQERLKVARDFFIPQLLYELLTSIRVLHLYIFLSHTTNVRHITYRQAGCRKG